MIVTVPQSMAGCGCAERPCCQMYACENFATGFALVPAWDRNQPDRATSKFTCAACWEFYVENWHKPIQGFTKPDWWPKDEPWKPHIVEQINLAGMKINERERRADEKKMREIGLDLDVPLILQKGADYTPEQLKRIVILSRRTREFRQSGWRG